MLLIFSTVVELPDEPDGKTYDDVFKREGVVEAATQTKPPKVWQTDEVSFVNWTKYYQLLNGPLKYHKCNHFFLILD